LPRRRLRTVAKAMKEKSAKAPNKGKTDAESVLVVSLLVKNSFTTADSLASYKRGAAGAAVVHGLGAAVGAGVVVTVVAGVVVTVVAGVVVTVVATTVVQGFWLQHVATVHAPPVQAILSGFAFSDHP